MSAADRRQERAGHFRGPREEVGGGEWIYGRNPVEEALAAGRREATEIVLPPPAHDDDQLARIRDEAHARRIAVRTMDRDRLDRLVRFGHHQGVALKVSGYPYVSLDEIVSAAADEENALVVLLDHVEDPQNLGSVLRTACAAGAAGASAGGAEHLRVAKVVNLVRAMEELKDAGFWITGLDMGEGARPYDEVDFKGKAALVVGAEGAGLSRLVRTKCDFIAELPMPGGFESLNAGVAAGIAIYEVLRQRRRR